MMLVPGRTCLAQLEAIYRGSAPVDLDPSCRPSVEAAMQRVADAASGDVPVYGVNTGFGKLASMQIGPEDTARLQRNLILSHCCGVGEPTPEAVVRLMMALKLLSLGRGASGVKWETMAQIEAMLAAEITPVVPAQGSVGASGDLAPLAHMAAAMIGEGDVVKDGAIMPATKALSDADLAPIVLGPKEGLALINGTQFSTAFALAGLFEGWGLARSAVVTGALSTDAIMGSTAPFEAEIHDLRGHRGQIEVAAALRALMEGSTLRESHLEGDKRVQDPYCIRCQPQVSGAAIDLLRQAGRTLEIEANAVTDNPLVLSDGQIVSGGNFHAEPVAFAADQIALALAEIGAITQRRVALMVDPTLSFDLPPFLTPDPGLNSGYMIAEVTSAALMSENKHLANPCSTDSTPTSANQEDHVSMAAHGARRLMRMTANLGQIIGIELLCAAQGVKFRKLKTSDALEAVIARLRQDCKPLEQDRYLATDLTFAADSNQERSDRAGRRHGRTFHTGSVGMIPVSVSKGLSCLVLAMPHTGTWLPDNAHAALNDNGRALADTDWHIDRLYKDLAPEASTVRANFHRYLIDANRDPSGQSLYPGQNTTGLCPLTDFDGNPIYKQGQTPDALMIEIRRCDFHAPYHAALTAELERVREIHGVAVLYDCHSIRSDIPYLFEGCLPDLNIGTYNGATCAPALERAAVNICAAADDYTSVLNGRFKGGWTTRHYGKPERGIHAIQMELAQSTYLSHASRAL